MYKWRQFEWGFAHRLLAKPKALFIIVGLGIAIRLIFLLLIASKPLMSDAASYNEMATRLLSGVLFVAYWPPGLPIYLAAVHKLFGESIAVLRSSMMVFYIVTSVFVYRVAVLLTGDAIPATMAVLFLAISPGTIHTSVEPLTQLPTAMFLILIIWALMTIERFPCVRHGVFLGLCIGYLALVRPSSLVLLLAVPGYLIWRMRRFLPAIIAFIAGLLIVGTWIGYVYANTGQLVKINTANGRNFYLGNNRYTPLYRTWWLGTHHDQNDAPAGYMNENTRIRRLDPVAQEAEFSRLAAEHIRSHPGLFLLRSFNRVCTYFAFDTFTGSYLIAFYKVKSFIGLAVLAVDACIYLLIAVGSILYIVTLARMEQRPLILLGILSLYAFPYFLAFSHPSYHYPIEPILTILACAAFARLLGRDSREMLQILKHRKVSLALVLVAFGLVQLEFLVLMWDRV